MKKIAAAILVVLMFSGCATIVGSPKQKVKVSAEPGQAHVVITSERGLEIYNGEPGEIRLPRKNAYTVIVSMPGYLDQKVVITQSFNGWVLGNICFGGIPGGTIDFLTGAAWKLEPDRLNIQLKTAMGDTEGSAVIVFYAVDENGELRSLTVPMIKA